MIFQSGRELVLIQRIVIGFVAKLEKFHIFKIEISLFLIAAEKITFLANEGQIELNSRFMQKLQKKVNYLSSLFVNQNSFYPSLKSNLFFIESRAVCP